MLRESLQKYTYCNSFVWREENIMAAVWLAAVSTTATATATAGLMCSCTSKKAQAVQHNLTPASQEPP